MNHSCENTSLQNVSVENLQFSWIKPFQIISFPDWTVIQRENPEISVSGTTKITSSLTQIESFGFYYYFTTR